MRNKMNTASPKFADALTIIIGLTNFDSCRVKYKSVSPDTFIEIEAQQNSKSQGYI